MSELTPEQKERLRTLLSKLSNSKASVRESATQEADQLSSEECIYLARLALERADMLELPYETLGIVLSIPLIGMVSSFLQLGLNTFGHLMAVALLALAGVFVIRDYKRRVLGRLRGWFMHQEAAPLASLALTREAPPGSTRFLLLKRLLPRLQPADVETWTTKQRTRLFTLLLSPLVDSDFTISAIHALKAMGDDLAHIELERLAHLNEADTILHAPVGKTITAASELQRIKQSAQEGLPSKILLRASQTPGTDQSDVLLRSVEENPNATPPEQLLRPR